MVWVAIVVALVMAVIGELLRPKPKFNDPKPSAVGDFSFPTADASRVIPVYWGTCKMQGPNVVWFGDLTIVTLKKKVKTGWFSSKKIVTGYNYYLGVQLVYAYGPTDEFIELRIDDKVAPISTTAFTGDVCAFTINAPTILDNDDPPNGVKGDCKLYRGTFTQPPNIYLSGVWGEPDMSAFRPLMHLVMEKCYLGNSDTPPPISIITRRCPNQLGLTGSRHNVNGDANIACAVYEVMTNNMWGMKIPENKIDLDSFIACGNTLADESIGISMLVQTAMLGKDLVAEMLRHADGVVYADPVTGLYTMTLAREVPDAELDELLVVDNSNILRDTFEFSRSSWEMTKNTIIVQYTDRLTFETKPVQYQDLANIDVRGGMIDSEEFSYLGFSNEVAAMNTAARVSKMKASPLVSAKMSLNRVGYQLRPGSAFWLRKPDRGLANILMRVIEIHYGTLDDPDIKITAMEDIFAVNAVAYVPPGPGDWTPPVAAVAPLTQSRLVEAPLFGSTDPAQRFVITLGVPASGSTIAYDVWVDTAGGTDFVQTNSIDALTPSGTLTAALPDTGPETGGSFTITGVVNAEDIDAGTAGSREAGENLLLVGDELIAWDDITDNGDGTYTVTGIYRGALDTVQMDHGSGARVYFMSEGAGTTNEDGYGGDVTLNAKLVPKSIVETLPLADADEVSITTEARALRPFVPGKYRVNGVRPGPAVTGQFSVSWAHRNRFDDTIASQAENSRVPEDGSTYNLRVRDSFGDVIVELLGISNAATTATVDLIASGAISVELEAERGGLLSWNKQVGQFTFTADGATENTIVADEPEYVMDGGGA